MGMVIDFLHGGYKSGRKSLREIPVIFSTARTRNGGISSHCETACGLMPSSSASGPMPPAAAIARCRTAFLSLMERHESIALSKNQVPLHCTAKAMLYPMCMELAQRIKMARKRRRLSQTALGELLGVSPQAVSQWETGKTGPERNMIPKLATVLKCSEEWLFHGREPLPPLGPDDLEVFLEQLMEVGKAIPEGQRGPAVQVLKGLVPAEPKHHKSRPRAS